MLLQKVENFSLWCNGDSLLATLIDPGGLNMKMNPFQKE